MWISKQQNKLFQITSKRTICNNITALQTGEGFILVDYKIAKDLNLKNKSNSAGDNDVKLIDETILTEMDYQNQLALTMMLNTFKIMNEKMCQLYKSMLSIFSKLVDEFFTINDFNGNSAILYSDEGRIFVPKCIKINEINIIEETKYCYKDIAIQIYQDNTTINAFLTQDKILRATSKKQTCRNNYQNIHLKDSNQLIVKQGNKITIEEDDKYTLIRFNLQANNISKINYEHDQVIINGVDVIGNVANLTQVTENELNFHVHDDDNTETKSDVISIIESIGKTIDSVGVYVMHKIATGISLGLVVTTGLMMYIGTARRNARNRRLVQQIWGTESVPMQPNAWNAFQGEEGPVTRHNEMRAGIWTGPPQSRSSTANATHNSQMNDAIANRADSIIH